MNRHVPPSSGGTEPHHMYSFNQETFDAATEEAVEHFRRGAEQGDSDPECTEQEVQQIRDRRAAIAEWAQEHSGRILFTWVLPDSDAPWGEIARDVRNTDIELSGELVDAALRHPSTHIASIVAMGRTLTDEQVAYVESLSLPSPIMSRINNRQSSVVPLANETEAS